MSISGGRPVHLRRFCADRPWRGHPGLLRPPRAGVARREDAGRALLRGGRSVRHQPAASAKDGQGTLDCVEWTGNSGRKKDCADIREKGKGVCDRPLLLSSSLLPFLPLASTTINPVLTRQEKRRNGKRDGRRVQMQSATRGCM